jgi:CheY-like chemotaxis protein
VQPVLPRPRFESAQILIVDDEPKNLDVLTRILHKAGYTNTFATTDPLEGLSLYAELDPDLLLLDLNMPKLDGVALMERLKQMTPRHGYLSVLVLTGDTSRQAQRRALAMGAKDFLTKPFEITEGYSGSTICWRLVSSIERSLSTIQCSRRKCGNERQSSRPPRSRPWNDWQSQPSFGTMTRGGIPSVLEDWRRCSLARRAFPRKRLFFLGMQRRSMMSVRSGFPTPSCSSLARLRRPNGA